MTCAAAIEQILREAGEPMRAAELAEEINRRGLYRRGDGAPLPAYQVASIAHGTSRRFRIDAGLIGLARWEPAEVTIPEAAPETEGEPGPPAAVLIGCVSRKNARPLQAKDLYRSELFARRRAYAEARGLRWFIVSAEHGLLQLDR